MLFETGFTDLHLLSCKPSVMCTCIGNIYNGQASFQTLPACSAMSDQSTHFWDPYLTFIQGVLINHSFFVNLQICLRLCTILLLDYSKNKFQLANLYCKESLNTTLKEMVMTFMYYVILLFSLQEGVGHYFRNVANIVTMQASGISLTLLRIIYIETYSKKAMLQGFINIT